MSRMFDFDPSSYAAQYASDGFVHIRSGLTEDFHRLLTTQLDELLEANRLENFAIGQKQQALYEFPSDGDYLEDFLDTVSAVCSFEGRKLVLSERHIKLYEAHATDDPRPHKDRFASQVAVGLSVRVPDESKLVLYPGVDVEANPFNSTAELWSGLPDDRVPEKVLAGADPVFIDDAPRDVIIFRGNSIWHHRSNRSNVLMLYLKLNSFNCDPLGEDPGTADAELASKALLSLPDPELERLIPHIGRKVDTIQRRYTREWTEALTVVLWGLPPLLIDEAEFRALRATDGRCDVAGVVEMMEPANRAEGLTSLRRLAAQGILELVPPLA